MEYVHNGHQPIMDILYSRLLKNASDKKPNYQSRARLTNSAGNVGIAPFCVHT